MPKSTKAPAALTNGLISNLLDTLKPYNLSPTEKEALKDSIHLINSQLVINRNWLIGFINTRLKPELTAFDYQYLSLDRASINTLVTFTSWANPKVKLTINNGSRFSYLLPQGLLLTMAYYLTNPDYLDLLEQVQEYTLDHAKRGAA